MKLFCDYCKRDLNAIWQDNMSYDCNTVICEDCSRHTARMRQKCQHESDGKGYFRKEGAFVPSYDVKKCIKCGEFYR